MLLLYYKEILSATKVVHLFLIALRFAIILTVAFFAIVATSQNGTKGNCPVASSAKNHLICHETKHMEEILDFVWKNRELALATVGEDDRAQDLAYFSVEIENLDYYDLATNPPTFRHYDGASGGFQVLDPFGRH